MGRRKNTVRVDTPEVQGDDSYVVVTQPTVREIRLILAESGDNLATLNAAIKTLAPHIREWDWVDDDDEPLPLPKDDESVIEQLTIGELNVLFTALVGSVAERKN